MTATPRHACLGCPARIAPGTLLCGACWSRLPDDVHRELVRTRTAELAAARRHMERGGGPDGDRLSEEFDLAIERCRRACLEARRELRRSRRVAS